MYDKNRQKQTFYTHVLAYKSAKVELLSPHQLISTPHEKMNLLISPQASS
jgi:hypothetical protein